MTFKSKSDLSNGVGVQLYCSAGRDASKRYPYGNTDFDILVLVFGKKNVEQTGDDLVDTCKNVQWSFDAFSLCPRGNIGKVLLYAI